MSITRIHVCRHSWHYKAYRYWRNYVEDGPILPFRGKRIDYTPKSLCSYFWTITALWAVMIPATLLLGVGLALVLPTIAIHSRVKARRDAKRAAAGLAVKESKTRLIAEFAKARKQKMCPLIELVD